MDSFNADNSNLVNALVPQTENYESQEELTYKILQTNSWKDAPFHPYDFNKKGFKLMHGSTHLLYNFMRNIRLSLNELGFSEVRNTSVMEAVFNNNRELKEVPMCSISEEFHKDVIKIKSSNLDYNNKALRHSQFFELLNTVVKRKCIPIKVFMVDNVFQNAEIQEFHVAEIIIADYELHVGNILGITSELFFKLNIKEVEYKPSLHSYTSPTFSACLYNEYLDNWISVAECGMVRPEICEQISSMKDVMLIRISFNVERILLCIKGASELVEIINPQIVKDP